MLATKLDRDVETGRFDAAQARRSLEESLEALGVDRVDILHLHDPEHAARPATEVTGTAARWPSSSGCKEEGLADAVGLAAGRIDVMMPLLRDWDFDVLVTHNRFTLVNRNAEPMLELARRARHRGDERRALCRRRALQGRGTLRATSIRRRPRRCCAPVRRVEEICARYGVPLGAAALQFSMRDPRIASTICGVTRPERVQETLDWAAWPIDDEVWAELTALPFSTDDPEATRDYKPG